MKGIRERMKGIKIANPVLRWFAGLGAFLVGMVGVGAVGFAVEGVFYGIGRLTLPFWNSVFGCEASDWIANTVGAGILTTVVVFIGFVILWGAHAEVRQIGELLFNSVAARKQSSST